MKPSLILALFSTAIAYSGGSVGGERPPHRPFETDGDPSPSSAIDELVFARLHEVGVRPARLCSDEVFVRRVFLDAIGTLPTGAEARQFLRSKDPAKRRHLIDRLLAREEFADYSAMRWGDVLRVKAEFPINLWPNGVQAYSRWIHTSIRENVPYDRFARQLLVASGSNFRAPEVNFYRAIQSDDPSAIAQAVALTFMGARVENWPEDRLSGMAAFFSYVGRKSSQEWKEEIVFYDSVKAAAGPIPTAVFPDGSQAELSPEVDPREVFADWLISPENPWFGRNIVNRIWYWLHGRGIIHEPDDIRGDNPPRHPDVLTYLEKELVEADYDLKHIYRLILNSTTYQLSCIPASEHPDAEALLAYYPLRRLDAEVLIDALCQITGTTETYSSPIPEPFTFIPESQRSIALADGSITSPFLELFGRPPRDSGLVSERNNRTSAAQRLHLLNSTHIQQKIEQSRKLRSLLGSGRKPEEIVNDVYLATLSRFPTAEELQVVNAYRQSGKVGTRNLAVDLVWALVNSAEFLYRH